MPDAPPAIDAPPPFMEAMPATVPQLVDLGGGVLVSPKIQPIVWTGDPLQTDIESFATQLATSSYWTATAAEYGVGAPTILPTIVVTGTAPTTDDALQTLVTSNLAGATPAWPYDPNTIYSIFLPPGTVLTGSDGSKSCNDYGAYHDEFTGANSQSIVYGMMPRCTDPSGTTSDLDILTESASHEWLEAATDPRVETTGAWGDADPEHYIWAYVPGAEIGDYCEYLDVAYQKLVGNYMVQRTWSNAAAKAGHDPCVPAPPDQIYVAAAPVLTEDGSIDGFNGPVTTKTVTIPVGMSKTIDVKLYSDDATDDFTVDALDLASYFGAGSAELTFAWDKTTGHNGDTLHLTITRKTAGQFIPGGSEFIVTTAVGTETRNMWWAYAK